MHPLLGRKVDWRVRKEIRFRPGKRGRTVKIGREKLSPIFWMRRTEALTLASQKSSFAKATEDKSSLKLWSSIPGEIRRSRQKNNLLVFWKETQERLCKEILRINFYNEEFDPGSGWTLAGGLTHASRGVTWCSNTLMTTGARVSNAYATYPVQGDSPEKFGLIPHKDIERHLLIFKVSAVRDGHA